MAERVDDLLVHSYKIVQDTDGFCFGIDAVLLADFAQVYTSSHTLDVCSGNGVVALLLAAKTDTEHFSCVEIQKTPYTLAQKSVALNGLQDRISLYHMDIKDALTVLKPHSFELITCNPPYTEFGCGLVNPADEKAAARHEIFGSLSDILHMCSQLLAPRGRITMVHKAQRLPDILLKMREEHLEPKTIRFVHTHAQSPANLVLIAAMAGGGKECKIQPPLFLYDEHNQLTKEAKHLYED